MMMELYLRSYVEQFAKLTHPLWNYEDGCVLTALQNLYEATGDETYWKMTEEFLTPYIGEDGTIAHYDSTEYNLDKIPPGRILYLLYEKTGRESYKKAIERLMEQLRTHPRTDCGSFWHKGIYPYQIWLDGLYMAEPFYLLYERYFGGGKQYEDIMLQFENARKYLFDEDSGLYHHVYDEKKCQFWADKETGLSPNFWSRAMGWFLMALADCYEIFPEKEQKYRERLAELLREMTKGLKSYQDPATGKLYQLTRLKEEKGNYLETSASAMLAYAILKGCRLGILDRTELVMAVKILCFIEQENLRLDGNVIHLTDICAGAGLGPADRPNRDGSVAYYLGEPKVEDEQKGVAAVLLAYSEWLKVKQEFGWKSFACMKGTEAENKYSNPCVVKAELKDVYWMRHAPGANMKVF